VLLIERLQIKPTHTEEGRGTEGKIGWTIGKPYGFFVDLPSIIIVFTWHFFLNPIRNVFYFLFLFKNKHKHIFINRMLSKRSNADIVVRTLQPFYSSDSVDAVL